jgi:hypothetical protein
MNKLFKLVVLLCLSIGAFAQIEVPDSIKNDTVTGTTAGKLVKFNTTGGVPSVIVTATTDTSGAFGICQKGCGTTGNAAVITLGQVDCIFDNTTVTNDYVQISSTVAGDCHDAGATRPTSGQILGTVFAAGGTAGTYTIYLNKDIYPSGAAAPVCSAVGSSDTISAAGVFATVCPITAANISGAGQVIEIRAHGVYTTTATATPIEHMRVNAFGTTGVCQYSGGNNALNTSLANLSWDVSCFVQILTTGAPGTATAWGTDNVAATIAGSVVSKNFSQNAATVSATTNATNNVTIEETATLVTGQSFTLQTLFVRNY